MVGSAISQKERDDLFSAEVIRLNTPHHTPRYTQGKIFLKLKTMQAFSRVGVTKVGGKFRNLVCWL